MRFRSSEFLLLCVIAVQLHGVAQVTAQQQTPEAAPLAQAFHRKYGSGWTIRLSADKKRIETVVGFGTPSYGEKPESAARKFLTENATWFGLRSDLGDLRVMQQVSHGKSGHVEFQQIVNGLPVENARVKVNLSQDGRVLQVASSYAPFEVAPTATTITKEQGTEAAITEFLRTTPVKTPPKTEMGRVQITPLERSKLQLKTPPVVEDIYYSQNDRLVRAYKITVRAVLPFGMKEFVIDAATGAVLRARDLIRYAVDGQGRVFIPDPIAATGDGTLRGNSNSATAVPNNAYSTVTLPNLDDAVSGSFRLSGAFARSEDIDSPSTATVSESTSTFSYDRSQSGFEETMAYYHISRNQGYIQALDFIDINNRQIRFDAHGQSDDNSHYDPTPVGAGFLDFGDGGSEDAEDAEVIVHEYGHSIQDNQTLGKYPNSGEAGAMGEGFGDYWAASNYRTERVAGGRDPACIMEWDTLNATPSRSCLRRTDTTKKYPADVHGEVHDDGEIWSGTLWDAFNLIGKTTTDRLVLQSHFNVPDGPKFKDGADAIVTADLQLFHGSHITQLCKVFKDRGIYKDSDCPSLPSSTGTQTTLVVLVRFNDAGLPSSPLSSTDVTNLINRMSAYVSEVSFTQVPALNPVTKGWFDLGKSRAHYYDETSGNMLVEMVQDVVNAIHAADSSFDFNTVDRMFILTNDDGSGGEARGQKEWATTGPWPYPLPTSGGTRRFSASVHRFDQSDAQFDHALGHHFGMFDLYPHEGVTFPRPYADGWSNMAKNASGNFNNSHFFGWDKLKPTWLTDANVTFIQRPPADPDPSHRFEQTFPIFREESNSANPVVLQVGTTAGVTKRGDERVSYYIEARKKSGTYDSNIPSDAVLIYYVNEDIGQGFGPVRLVDANPGTSNDLTDAGFLPAPAVSSVNDIDGTGLNVEVLPKVGTEDYRVHITYDPPETQNDVWIHPHDQNWRSQDIWVDSPSCNNGVCGFDADNSRPEMDRGDKPVVGQVNRVYARVYNHGPGTAHNVRVDFYFSEPHHAIDGSDVDPDTGDNVSWNKHFFAVINDLPPTDTGVVVRVDWTPDPLPSGQDHPHTCIKVKIQKVFNDTNDFNQASQENIDEYDITSHSPYPPVIDDFKVVNPYDHPILTYFRADDVPVGWTASIVPAKAYLPVGGSVDARMTIQAPIDYPVCSTEFLKATAWYPAGDTLVPLGASVAQVNLKKSTDLTVNTSYGSCNKRTVGIAASNLGTNAATGGNCQALTTQGCTNPPRPFEHITLTYTGPDGKPIYHDVVTDKNGCFQDFLVNPQGGPWSVQPEYPGNDCNARTDGTTQTTFVPPAGGIFPPPRGGLWYSFHLGLNSPIGSFKKSFDPGPSLTLNLEYPYKDNFSIVGMFGVHVFGGNPNTFYYRNFSVDARAYFPLGWTRFYAQAGPGVYLPKTGSNAFGLNVGTGLSFPVLPKLKIEVGPDLHFVDPSNRRHLFIDAKMGVVFHF